MTHIDKSAEDAIKRHDATDLRALRVYGDGSGIDGDVGATAITLNIPVDVPAKRTEYIVAELR